MILVLKLLFTLANIQVEINKLTTLLQHYASLLKNHNCEYQTTCSSLTDQVNGLYKKAVCSVGIRECLDRMTKVPGKRKNLALFYTVPEKRR